MKQRLDIQHETEQTMRSLDGAERAEPAPYFYTRLMARMQQARPADAWDRLIALITRPSVAITALILVLGANGFMFVSQLNNSTELVETTRQQTFADEYQLGINTFYEYEKTEP
ncbi:hypothetical protein EGT74_18355 [Chitinophaga lutea]|uniref:ABC transporter permease n=1 Tax=Chitinophaga lutea TaxID=2488634 RepID=A0A3N4PL90_9BACT|nr:hypothetical protein [Chitinophaga lutea]RPE08976.1 hypothetical protein EGT74_18355 [Chitinophaga lutea]